MSRSLTRAHYTPQHILTKFLVLTLWRGSPPLLKQYEYFTGCCSKRHLKIKNRKNCSAWVWRNTSQVACCAFSYGSVGFLWQDNWRIRASLLAIRRFSSSVVSTLKAAYTWTVPLVCASCHDCVVNRDWAAFWQRPGLLAPCKHTPTCYTIMFTMVTEMPAWR